MPRAALGPEEMLALLARARGYVERRFENFQRNPEEGWIRVDGERFVLVRCESLYLGLFDGMSRRFGDDAAFEMIYVMARDIGHSDCEAMCSRMGGADNAISCVAGGPPFFAFNGWAAVELLPTTQISTDEDCVIHYVHPNTFESEVLAKRADISVKAPACLFSAGYSAGWGSASLDREMHAREIACVACGDPQCEFIMAPKHRLDDRVAEIQAAAQARGGRARERDPEP